MAKKSFLNLDREHSGYLTKEVFMDAMVQQAVSSGMELEEAKSLMSDLEAEFM